jgi:hypothetical protein
MTKLVAVLAATGLLIGISVESVEAGQAFHPLRTIRSAANLGLNTAKRAVDLGLDTAKGAVDVAKNAVTPDNCPRGERYRGRDGEWHICQ